MSADAQSQQIVFCASPRFAWSSAIGAQNQTAVRRGFLVDFKGEGDAMGDHYTFSCQDA